MIQVGVTGLRDLTGADMTRLKATIYSELDKLKKGHDKSMMLNSIAAGADQLCAEIGLSLGYELVCPLPFSEYRNDFCGEGQKLYDILLGKASNAFVVPDSPDKEASYLATGKYIVENCDVLLAVWDGKPQASICGTATVVAYAKCLGKEVKILF